MPQVPILMPQLGESIAEAIVVSIRVTVGETVEADQQIIDVETNKAMMTVTTPCRGVISAILAEPDVSYAVGAALAHLEVSDDEAAAAGMTERSPAERAPFPEDAPHFSVRAEDMVESQPTVKPTIEGLPVPAKAAGASYLSPRMKARMTELGLNAADLAGVAGSGSGGRVTIEDFEKFLADLDRNKTTPASPMRIAVADSMRRSWTRPLATVGSPVNLDAVLAHRRSSPFKAGPALYSIRALALALAENTAVAGRLIGTKIVHPRAVDIGFAVEVEDGVLVPVIREVNLKPLAELVPTYNSLVEQARQRRLPPEAVGAGIATVTNFGTFGIVWATPIPLPEQNLVLGLGQGRKQPVWSETGEKFVPAVMAELTLSFDHRILDGGAAGRLLARVSEFLQDPEAL